MRKYTTGDIFTGFCNSGTFSNILIVFENGRYSRLVENQMFKVFE